MLLLGNAISFIFITDGAPAFNSSNISIWSGQFMIAELPPHLRKNIIVLSFWWVVAKNPARIYTIMRGMVNSLKIHVLFWI
jgi:hypothetical protein